MRTKTIYRALLHCYPAAFRHEYGNRMLLLFADQLGEARRTGGRLQQAALWAHAALDTIAIAPKEQTDDGRTRVACRFAEGTVWLTQAAMAGLFQTTPQNITLQIAPSMKTRSFNRTQPVRNTYKFGRRVAARSAAVSNITRCQ